MGDERVSFLRVHTTRQVLMIPTKKQLADLEKKINRHKSKLDKEGYPKEPTLNFLKAHLRSSIRKFWMRADVKLAFLLSHREPDYSESRNIWKHECNKCKEYFKEGDVEVDHIEGEKTFTDVKDALAWLKSLLYVSMYKDLQILCKPCHAIKSYCEKLKLDWTKDEDWTTAIVEKTVLAICKGSGSPEKKWLESKGIMPESNKDKRKSQVREYLINQERD